VRVARDEGIAAALALGASRASLHRWRTRYEAGGLEALADRPRGPLPVRLPAWVEQAVIVVRLLTYWNSKRLAAEFTRREIYPLDHHAVDALLAGLGTPRPSVHRERGPAYERTRPNELWHIDIKGPFFLRRSVREYEKVWIVGLVDDHSRFLVGLRVLPQPRAAPILAWLDDCVELCGTPLELMSDNGTPFVVWMPGVLTLFGRTLAELHIRHVRTQVNSPWTNGMDRALLGDPAVGAARPRDLPHTRGGRRRARPLCRLLQLRPAPRRARLAHAGRTLRRNAIHRPRLRTRAIARPPAGLAHRADVGS
jgi:transposase